MKTRNAQALFLIVAAFGCVLVLVQNINAFDVGGWYYDPMSLACWHKNDGVCSWEATKENIRNCNMQFLQWCDSLGFQWLCVQYKEPDCFGQLAQSGTHVKAVNTFNGGIPFCYQRWIQSQGRTVYAKENMSDWYYLDSWSCNLNGYCYTGFSDDENAHKVEPSIGAPCNLWSPTHTYKWNGWQGTEHNDNYMPMHFRVTCAVDTDGAYLDSHVVAKVFWMVARNSTSWIRYPAMEVKWDSLLGTDGSAGNTRQTLEYFIDPDPNSGNSFDLLNSDYEDSILNFDISHSFAGGQLGYLSVEYEGYHTFYLEKVDICDDDYYKLLWAPEETRASIRDSIRHGILAEYNVAGSNYGGWCSDDFSGNARPLTEAAKIFHDLGIPHISSSWNYTPGKFYSMLASQGVPPPFQANETYFFGRDSTCRPTHPDQYPIDPIATDSVTDRPYLTLVEAPNCVHCIPHDNNCGVDYTDTAPRYNGSRSLQCALDDGIWSLSEEGLISCVPTAYQENFRRFLPHQGTFGKPGLVEQTTRVHQYGAKSWPFLLSGQFTCETDECDCNCSAPWREPTDNELKLSVWIAVACDVDGVMWYGTVANEGRPDDAYFLNGLFEWSVSETDHSTDEDYGSRNNFCQEKHIWPTSRYFAAREVLDDVRRIEPVLKQLDFEKTYASRAFE